MGVTFGNQIPRMDEWVATLSLIGALISLVVNCWAARTGLVVFRTAHAAITAISAIYVAGYLWLLLGDVGPAEWSSVMRGFSLVAWVAVWIVPAVISVRVTRALHAAIKERTEGDS